LNGIVWGNEAKSEPEIDYWPDYSIINVRYSDVRGGWSGQSNINDDPCFVLPGYWYDPNTIDDFADDIWIDGDYHLQPGSPCIDAGNRNYIAEPNETDLDGNPRIVGDIIDMGAYEYNPLPAEVSITPTTVNLAREGNWITCQIRLPDYCDVADINPDSIFLNNKIKPESVQVNQQQQLATASFRYEQIHAILTIGDVELTITGWLNNGVAFEGKIVLRVMHKASGKPDRNEQACNPDPADGAIGVSVTVHLSWVPGLHTTSHDVYFGTTNPPPFVGNQTDATFDPGRLGSVTTYYWRVNEVNKWGTTTGDIWHFTTVPFPPPPPP
jgi:hypothetical protein